MKSDSAVKIDLTAASESPQVDQTPAVALYIALTVAIFALAGTFTNEKLSFLYKEVLNLSASQSATLAVILGIPAYLRPFMGAGADLFPLFGYHRRSYFATACAVMALGYAGLAMLHGYHYAAVVGLVLVSGAGGVFALVIMDAVMVSIGNLNGTIGRLQTLQRAVPLILSLAFTARLSGYVTQHWTYEACFATAAVLAAIAALIAGIIPERRIPRGVDTASPSVASPTAIDRAHKAAALRAASVTPGLWAMVGFVFYLIVTPGTSTAQFYYMVDELHFSKQLIGNLGMAGSAGSIVGIIAFAALTRRLPVRAMVWGAYLCDCCVYLTSMLLHNVPTGYAVTFLHSGITSIYVLCLYTLAARACPPGIEGTIYGLVLAAISLATNLGEQLGASIYDHFGPTTHHTIAHGWHALLWFGFAFTAIAIVFIPFLPEWTRDRAPLHPAKTVDTASTVPPHAVK